MILKPIAALLAVALVAGVPSIATAQEQQQTRPNAVGAGGAGAGSETAVQLTDAERTVVSELDGFFNAVEHLEGQFVQTDAQGQTAEGKFYVQRPGKFRFVYNPPSRLVILSDGEYLSIEDYDLDTVERYSLDSTPFRILLSETVDILKDAIVTNVAIAGPLVSVAMRDRANASSGKLRITVLRNDDQQLELKEWVVTDAQGLDTTIAVSDLVFGQRADDKLFVSSKKVGASAAFKNER